jgi:(2Fe-2S) ferredoxin
MVLVWPDDIWYSHVRPQDVAAIATQHLQQGRPVEYLRDRQPHPKFSDEPTPDLPTGSPVRIGVVGISGLG